MDVWRKWRLHWHGENEKNRKVGYLIYVSVFFHFPRRIAMQDNEILIVTDNLDFFLLSKTQSKKAA